MGHGAVFSALKDVVSCVVTAAWILRKGDTNSLFGASVLMNSGNKSLDTSTRIRLSKVRNDVRDCGACDCGLALSPGTTLDCHRL